MSHTVNKIAFQQVKQVKSLKTKGDLKMTITKEQLLSNSHMAKMRLRDGRSVKLVLTNEEQNELAKRGLSFKVHSDKNVFFFTDDYCAFVGELDFIDFVPSSTVCPCDVVPREGLEDGWVNTAEKYIQIFNHDIRQITTIDELVEYINNNYFKD